MPLEVELLIAAWDNVKKNVLGGDGMNIDPETGEIIDTDADVAPELADLTTDINDLMMDLVGYYRDAETESGDFVYLHDDA